VLRSKWGLTSVIIGYIAGLVTSWFLPVPIALIFPVIGTIVGSTIRQAELKVSRFVAEREASNQNVQASISPQSASKLNQVTNGELSNPSVRVTSQANQNPDLGPEWTSIMEYIDTIEDMVLLEGEKNNLDNEIVQRTLSLLVRLNRIIPELVTFNNGDINHKIQRLVLKDLNGAINPFIHLSGEAKRQNRRILLNSIKDIDNQISTYTSFIEQKDLMELKNKADLIHQRYGLRN
jgi:uncharacterized membrane protein YeaQ/YmgE (transglycosylase-associated protein family)